MFYMYPQLLLLKGRCRKATEGFLIRMAVGT